ncbi:hypothetical protein [Intestinibacter sp.]|uniref:hypothetical protein n=1 Tax=Intestinibacter sp. TaxID=1965304 RepID=UPI003F1485AA
MEESKIVLRSVFGKVGMKYYIQPCRDKNGNWPECVKQVDSFGNMIVSDAERNSGKPFIKVTETFTIEDGKTFDLTDPWDEARWEAIKNCPMIADSREQRDAKGNLIIDGDSKRYGRAELYIERPGVEVQKKVSKRQKIHDAESYIFDDPRGAEGRLKVARILGKHMSHASDSDIKDYLLEIASRDPDKIIKLYTGEDLELRTLFLDARDKGVIRSVSGIYVYGDGISLGGTIDVVISWMRDPRNKKLLESIKRDTYPDLEVSNPKALEKLNKENK